MPKDIKLKLWLIIIPFLFMYIVSQGNHLQIVQGVDPQENTIKLKPYENTGLGIKTQYPANWTIHESKDSVRFLSHPENALDNHTEQIKISSYAPGSVPFFQSEKTSLPDLANNTINYLSQSKKGFELLNSELANANGKSGHLLEYFYTSAAGQTESLGVVIPYNGKVYFVSYFADPEKYPALLPVVLNIINSTDIGVFNTDNNKKSNDDTNSGNSNDDNDKESNDKDSDDDNDKDSDDDKDGPIDEAEIPSQ